ncbi:MAG: SpoIID/LytB domain-containing protein [Candidatus Omnitrophota bacterium]
MKLIWRILFLIFVIQASAATCQQVTCEEPSRYVRVAVFQEERSLRVKLNAPFEITDSSGSMILKGDSLKTTVIAQKDRIVLAGESFKVSTLIIRVDSPSVISVNDRLFRGQIQFIRGKKDTLIIINLIDLEDYVKGILYHEVSHYWPMEALMAQAIVSRTYALYQMEENKAKDYDVTSDIYSQVYGGRTSERYRTNRAVEQTKGKILNFEGKVFPTYFSATCAGHTERSGELWKIDMTPLKGVVCGFCKDSPHFRWHYVLSLEEIQEKLSQGGIQTGRIKDLVILERNESGRVKGLKIITADGEQAIAAKDFRSMIGVNIIRSTRFNVSVINEDAVFEGAGWGHGVGLCQWGAYFMAKQGRTHKEILTYYYPGSQMTND